VVELLIEAGADVDSILAKGFTSLRLGGTSTASKALAIIGFLEYYGAVTKVLRCHKRPTACETTFSPRRARGTTQTPSSSMVAQPHRPKSVTPFDGAAGSTQSNVHPRQGAPSQTAASIQPSPALSIRSIPAPSSASVFRPRETRSTLELSHDPPMPPPIW
jgi:hypothetical protein